MSINALKELLALKPTRKGFCYGSFIEWDAGNYREKCKACLLNKYKQYTTCKEIRIKLIRQLIRGEFTV